jgi:hypothetical protein
VKVKKYLAAYVVVLALSIGAFAQSQVNSRPVQNTSVQNTPAPNGNNVPQTIYLPSGLDVQIRVNEMLSSATSQPGDTFTGSLVSSIEDDNGNIIFQRGDQVSGRVVSVKPSGRLQDSGQLVLTLNNIRSDQQIAGLTVVSKEITGASHTASNTTKVGGGAILGAIIGGIAGGGSGAAIGAATGAAAGTGAAAATGKKEARVDSEGILRFVTSAETTVVPINSPAARAMETQPSVYNDSGPRDANAPVLHRRRDSNSEPNSNSNGNYPSNSNSYPNNNYPNSGSNNYPNDNSYPNNRNSYPGNNYPNNRQDSTVASNNTPDDAPVLRRRGNSSSDSDNSIPAQRSSNPPSGSPQTATNAPATSSAEEDAVYGGVPNTTTPTNTGWEFSARDRRVITSCLASTPSAVPAATPNAIPYHKGDTLPYAAQKQAQPLPLACEKQLPAAASNTERVIYNQQVLLLNTNSLILDSIDLNH